HISSCASGSEISLRSQRASSSRQRGGAKRSQISSPTSACVMVPSKSTTMLVVGVPALMGVAVLQLVGRRLTDLGDRDVELEGHAGERVGAGEHDVVALDGHDPEGVALAVLVGALELGAGLELEIGGQVAARHADLLLLLFLAVALGGRH